MTKLEWRVLGRRVTVGLLVTALQVAPAAQAADLSQQMANLFGSGALSTSTGPGAYHSQTQNIYTGGELQLRFPSRTYQLWSLSMPSIKAGCGGVDAYMGSFSHISSAQFKDMLQSVARSYAGLLFKAALKSINPMIESVIGDLQKTLEAYGQFNGNTCAMAQALAFSTMNNSYTESEGSCTSAAMSVYDEDEAAAKRRCKVDQTETNDAAKNSGDAKVKELAARDLNLVWEALKPSSFSQDERTVFMNIAGTIIIYKAANNDNTPRVPAPHDPSIDSLKTLLFGDQPGNSADEVIIANWLTCPDSECLQPTRGAKSVVPFPVHVRHMLEGIRDAMQTGNALSDAQKAFVGMTRVPVYRLLAAGYTADSASRRDEVLDLMIDRYSKVIAYDYAHGFMRKALTEMRVYLGMAKLSGKVEEAQSKRLIDNVDRLMAQIDSEHTKALQSVRDSNAVIEDLVRVERDIRTALPGSVRGMLDMSNLMRGARG